MIVLKGGEEVVVLAVKKRYGESKVYRPGSVWAWCPGNIIKLHDAEVK